MSITHIPGFQSLPLAISQLNLPAVLKCGQSFRWTRLELPLSPSAAPSLHPDCEWRLSLQDRVVCLRQTPTHLFYRSLRPSTQSEDDETKCLSWLKDYFQLDVDLMGLYDDWSHRDAVFRGLRDRFSGIRMLRQDPWENLISFICSQNNHISRIGNMVQSLCTHFSPPLLTDPEAHALPKSTYHAFPPPESLSNDSVEQKLRDLGFGYRAKYIQKTAAHLCAKHEDPRAWLMSLRKLPTEEAKQALLELSGVGPKVADCILLMSLDKAEVVPVDTHVLQIATRHYGMKQAGKGNMTPAIYAQVAEKLEKVWGPYAGWAHSVVFTADLRAFANFNMPSPSPSDSTTLVGSLPGTPTKEQKRKFVMTESPLAQKRSKGLVAEEAVVEEVKLKVNEKGLSMVERVKSRRRTKRLAP